MASSVTNSDLIEMIASEMSFGVERAVDWWMSQVDNAMTDNRLTTLGRLNAVKEILERYRVVTGRKPECRREGFDCRRSES